MSKTFIFKDKIFVRVWDEVLCPKGIVQIIHGMGEHSLRYDANAKFFNSRGYIVYADDHRGNGYSVTSPDKLGDVDHGFETLVEDEADLTDHISESTPELPVYILGHSMGSFIAQGHMKSYRGNVGGYILSGSCGKRRFVITAGWLTSIFIRKVLKEKKGHRIKKIMFSGYNSKIENQSTTFDWLTRDGGVVKDYINDPIGGVIYSSKFYSSFLYFLKNLYIRKTFKFIDSLTPIFILSGDKDPVGLYGRGVRRLFRFYKSLSFKNVQMKLYREGRHEMLNELNKEEVLEDIVNWIEKNQN